MAASNLLVKEGRLNAVIDFGSVGVGDPSCDLTIAYPFLDRASRSAFRDEIALDASTWERARSWVVWKALISLAKHGDTKPSEAKMALPIIHEVLAEHLPTGTQQK